VSRWSSPVEAYTLSSPMSARHKGKIVAIAGDTDALERMTRSAR
jgi:hypothetical protein